MAGVYGWIRSLTGYFLFLAVLNLLLCGKKYQKYIRLFAGSVLLLVVWQPIIGKSGLENQLTGYYESLIFRLSLSNMDADPEEIGEEYRKRMIAAFEEEVASRVTQMAEEAGYQAAGCQVSIGKEEGSERYGMVERIELKLTGEGNETAAQTVSAPVQPVVIEPVEVGGESSRIKKETEGDGSQAGDESRSMQEGESADAETKKLQMELADFYDLEEEHVEIQIAQGEG